MNTAYDQIQNHEMIELILSTGENMSGEVVAKDSDWVMICTHESNIPWCVAKVKIVAFRTIIE